MDEKQRDYILERIESIQDGGIGQTDWKLGFSTAYLIQRYLMSQGRPIDEVKSMDPWMYETEIEALYDDYCEKCLIDTLEMDELMESFVDCWSKTEHTDPLEKAWTQAIHELKDQDRSSLKARSAADDKLLKRVCELMSAETDIFYLPTRKLGDLMKKNRNYTAIKLQKLIKEGFLTEVQKGNQRQSPRYKLNPDHIEF